MPGVLRGEPFALEDMAEVPAAGGADDLGAAAVGIRLAAYGTGEGVVEARPAAAGVELAVGGEEGRAATPAGVGAVGAVLPEASREGPLGAGAGVSVRARSAATAMKAPRARAMQAMLLRIMV